MGHTAPKTKAVLKRAMGGVLLIDEAYYLHRADSERDYGQEAIEILLQVMEAQRGDLVVILAATGTGWIRSSPPTPGWPPASRTTSTSPTSPWTSWSASPTSWWPRRATASRPRPRQAFREYTALRMAQPRFANARSVRNAIDRMRLRQANRLVAAGAPVGRDDLIRLEPDDIRVSRVFGTGP